MKNLYSFFPKNKQLLRRSSLRLLIVSLTVLTACQQQNDKVEFVKLDEESYHAKADAYKLHLLASAIEMKTHDDSWQMSFDNQGKIVPQKKDDEILYENISPHTEMVVYDKGANKAGYDLIVHPGGTVEDIVLQLEHDGSTNEAFINEDGALLLPIEEGYLKHSPPIAYQEIDGEKNMIESRFHLEDGLLSFEVDTYQPEHTLIIDPEISFIPKAVNEAKQVSAQKNTAAKMMMAPDCPPMPVTNPYIGGKVFEDFGQDGTLTANIDQPISGITVTAYANDGSNVGSTTTSVDGDYLIESAMMVMGETYRVEFTGFPSNMEPSFVGSSSGSSVQFVSSNSCNVNFGLIDPRIYSEPDPTVVTSCYTEHEQTSGDVLISFPFSSTPQASEANDASTWVQHESDASQIGTTFGLAYHRKSGKLFAAAFMKRFSGFLSGQSGGIYVVTSPDDGATSGQLYLDLSTLHPTAGGTDPHDFTTTTGSGDVIDQMSFNAVGRRAFGDIDLNDDQDELYVISLNDRRLYTIPVANDPSAANAPTMAAQVPFVELNTAAALPGLGAGLTSGVNNDEIIPFALKYWRGKLYIGFVGNGQSGGPIVAFVYEYDPSTSTMGAKVLEFTLVYDRGCAFAESPNCWGPAAWQPWWNANTYPPVTMDSPYSIDEQGYPQAIFTDIEFLSDGTMVVGLRDRFGDQGGFRVAQPDDPPGGAFSNVVNDAFGDILVAQKGAGNTWSLNIADFTDNTVGNSAGTLPIAGGESSFGADDYISSPYIHEETAMGGLGVLLRENGIVTPSMDPRVNAFSNGIDWFNADGTLNRAITILTNTNSPFGKANGLGEVEFISREAPIEIGNRIWKDDNGNGIQDPGEDGINGVLVELYKETAPSTFTKVAETTTASDANQGDGAYKFSINGTAGQTWMGGFTEVEPNMTYEVRVSLTNLQSGDPNCTGFTAANQTSDATNDRFTDLTDSDAIENANVAVINFSTTEIGESNHSLDIGAIACSITLSNLAVSSCVNGDYTLTGDVSYTGGPTPLGLMTISVDNDGVTASVQIDPSSVSSFSIPNLGCDGDQNVVVTASFDNDMTCSGTENYDEPICALDIVITSVSSCSGGTYTVDGTITATNAPAGGITVALTESGTPQTLNLASNATTFQFTGLTCDGDNNIAVSAQFNNQTSCSDTETYDEPCFIDITNVAVTDNCVLNGTYDVVVTYTVYNAPGNLTIGDGNTSTTVNYAAGADEVGGVATLSGIACSMMAGNTVTVTADLGGGCMDSDTYTQPILPASLGDTVWEDIDGDGVQDGGEPGVEGATVTLYTCVGGVKDQPVPGGVTTTDASGFYEFTGLAPGDYCVQFDPSTSTDPDAANFVFTVQDSNEPGADDTNDSDVNPNTGDSPCVNLVAGENDPTIDAGVYAPASIGDTVWEDVDGDGVQDGGEPGVEGATVTLYTCVGGVKDQPVPGGTTTTDASGFYEFTGLAPGDYCVQFDPSTSTDPDAADFTFTVQDSNEPGADDTNDSDIDPNTGDSPCVNLESGENDPTIDAGVYVPASLGDTVWEDVDGDGVQDGGEPGVEGATVTLYTCVGGVKDQPVPGGTTTTDASGFYEFTGLAPGDYCVQFDPSTSTDPDAADFTFTVQDSNEPGADDTNDSDVNPNTGDSPCVNLESGENDPTIDAGVYVPASIGDTVWEDVDGDGVQDGGEPGVEGATVTLYTCVGGVKDQPVPGGVTTTDASGFYEFTGLAPGDYCVQFDPSTSTDPDAADFTFTVQDSNEPGADDTNDSDIDPNTGDSPCVNLESGENDPTIDAGVYVPASLGDTVWEDVDGDGVQDGGEPGVEGATVTLYTCVGGVKDQPVPGGTTTTDASGFYEFTGLAPGDYCVQFDPSTSTDPDAASFTFTVQDSNEPGADDTNDSDVNPNTGDSPCVNLESGENDPTIDAGVYVAAGLGDTVWEDVDGDGVQDGGEPGVEGVTVTLYTCVGGVKDQPVPGGVTTTDASGFYEFTDLVPGDYCVQFDPSTSTDPDAADFTFTVQDSNEPGADDTNDSDVNPNTGDSPCVNLESGENDPTIDAGVYVPASLGDTVWEDVDGDGVQDGGEPGVEGATVTLYTCVGGVKDQPVPGGVTTTDASGFYEFTGLAPGDYCVQFDPSTSTDPDAADFTFTVQDSNEPGADDTNDSDIDPNTGDSPCVNLESGENDPTVDAGVYVPASLGDTVWEDVDGDGVQDGGEPGVEGATVTLYTCVGGVKDQPVPGGTTTTDASGFYEFTGLAPGDYCVQLDPSTSTDPDAADFTFTVQDSNEPGADDTNDSDVNPNTGDSPCVNLESGENDPTIDAGVYVPASIGDTVWEDVDYNGVQDGGEPGVEGATVTLYTCVGGVKDQPVPGGTTTTDASGFYEFTGLAPGDYCVQFDPSTSTDPNALDFVFTVPNSTAPGADDTNDSDVDPVTFNSPCVNLESREDDPTIDAGVTAALDYGDLPDSYSTLATSNGASHSLKSGLYLGSCVDFEPTGSPDAEAGTDGSGGDDQSTAIFEEGTCAGNDDEDGITLLTQLIPGSTACIEVTATSVNGTAVLNTWIDFNGDGDFAGDANENLIFTSIDGAPIAATTDAPVANGTGTYVYCFDVPADATFPTQELFMRARLSMNGGLPYDGPADSGEVEDYYQPLAKIGNFVWEDVNGNAIQDGGESGIMGITVTITGMDLQGNNVQQSVTTGSDGMYMFPGLLPGQEYCINFDLSTAPNAGDLLFTPQDVPYNMDEVNDSDADVQTGDAGCYTLNPLEYNEDVDAGVYYDADGDLIPDSPDGNMELDPQGYIYCEDSGEIIPGGLVQVTAGPGVVNMIQDGSTGEYQFFVSQPGTYTISFTPPPGYIISTACLDQGLLDPDPMDPNPFLVGSNDADNDGFLDDASCGANTFYMQFTLEVGEFILQNNIPLSCAEIGDTVWEDNDTDGIQDPGEPGVPDIAVLLFECAGGVKGNQIGTTTTDASGNYEFTGLPGNVEYCVQFDLASSTNPNAGLYFFTTPDQTNGGGNDTNDSDANTVDGCTTSENVAPGEEYDDFDAGVYLIDMGDLIEGTGYPTTLANMGAAHSVPSAGALLKLGATVDAETDGQPSVDALGDGVDEDGVILPMFMTGIPEDIDVSVMNMTGNEAKLVMFVDWNNDGDFDDVNEMYSVMVPDGATVVTLDDVTPPLTANLAVPIGVRFRISTDQAVVMSPTGLAPDGEVEDYIAPSMGFDYGDLNDVALGTTGDPGQPLTPADYQTTFTDNGPRHKIITDINDNPILKIGSAVDDEANGQPSADAGITGGDDNAIAPGTSDPDDEDGLDENNLPLFIITQTTTLDIPVMNMTGAGATIAVFVDFNKDGAFDPGTERFEAPVPDMATTVSVNIPVPLSSVIGQDVGLRIRLANEATEIQTAVGLALSGEVEDYMVQIVGFDYGDLPDSYGTTDPDGPKHIVSEDLLLGSCVDVELDGQEEAMAGLMSGGDDNGTGLVTFGSCMAAGDDEDGIVFSSPLIPGHPTCVEVTSVNNTGADAVLQMWVDYNGDGAFGVGEEVSFTSANGNTIPDGGVISEAYCFDVPSDATFFGGAAFVRFRLSPNGGTVPDGQDINAVQFGEIEDYKVPLYKVGSYVWDDLNGDGLQDDFSSPCMDDVEMQLVWGGPDDNLATTGDNQTYLVTSDEVNSIHGQFVFCGLIPGSYELSIADIPSGLAPTVIGAGVDPNYDSNDPNGTTFTIPVNATLPTGENGVGDQPGGINGFPDTQDNLSFDFGLVTDGYTITCNCDGSITLDWDPFAGGDSWTVTLEDENGFPALDFVNMPDHVVTIAPGSLNNGECYRVAITENLSGNEVTSIYGPFHANCYPVPAISMTGVGPTCPDSQDGEVTITITEQGCAATYDVYLTSQNSGELLVGDDIQITAPIVVPGLGEDTYGVRMELVDRGNCAYGESCFPLIANDLLFLQNTDTEPPTKLVYDASGAEVTDMVINYDALPEGECGVQFSWSVVLNDNCLSAGVNLAASITTSSTNPSVTPSASVTVLDNTPTYAVEVFAGVGTNTLTLTATDFNGNENVMVYTINVADNRDPVLYCPTDMNVEIPSCEDEAPVNWTVSVVDDCDLSPTLTQTAGPASGDVLAPGIYNVSYEATDDYGNTGSCSFTITVTQAPSPAPIVDVSGNGNYEIEHCEEDGLIVFSGNVYDCDLDAASFNPADLIVQTTPLSPDAAGSLQISYTLPQDGYVYFEATGNLTAGSYLIITSYQGVTVDHGVIVSQDADQPAVIDMPGNLSYQAADCEAEVPVSFAVQLSDDCDEDLGSASFTVNGAPAPPYDAAASDPTHGLYVWNLSLSAGTYTIVGTYTDGGGNTTVQEVTITVNGTQDDWAPIITYPSQNMDIELDPCGPSTAPVVFEVSATDDCDGDLTPTVSISGGSVMNVGGTNTYIAMVTASGCETVTITSTDAAGNTRTEDFQICVNQDPAPLAALICNDDINVTLDDNCQREITADMLLEGEFGCFDNNNFTITIQDDDPSNGNILDGCGEFIYEIDLDVAAPTVGFTDDFAAANWSVVEDAGGGDAYVDFTSTTLTLGTLAGNDAIAMIPMPGDGTLSFDYDYNGADPTWDFFIVDLDGNQIIDVTDPTTGSYSSAVESGWMLVFHVEDDGALPVGSNDPSEAVVSNFVFAPTADLPGPIDFQPCWGYITGEDKTAPVLECPASTGTGTIVKNGYILSGTIDTDDPTVVVNDWSCLIDNAQPASAGERYVDILPFQVDVSDVYTFLVESDVTQTGNVGFAIYQGGYDVDNPCENIIAQSDILNDGQGNGVGNPLPGAQANDAYVRLALPLQAGATYYLATTTFTPEATGNYQYSICSDDNGQVGYFDTTYVTNPDWSVDEIISFTPVPTSPVTIELPLHCEDFDAIYNNPSSLSLVGSPIVSDNCDQNVAVTFEDTYEQFGDCGDIVITRTFTAVDDKGNSSSCTQVITLSSVIANNRGDSEVWLPPFTVPIECDEDYPTLANGNPTPAIAGYPFVYTVSGIFDLTQGQYCNVGASFEDSPSIVVCDGAFKFTRTWTIVDWCNPIDFYTYSQIIKVGDFTAPTVSCPGEDYDWDGVLDAPVYSTSPFACTAAFEVPLPSVEDNCSDYEVYTEIVTAVEVDVVDQYGQVTGTELDTITVRIVEWDAATRYVSGIPMGAHYFYYLVEDDCGNQTEVYCPFSVEDQIEPTAVCDDDLHVSIAGNDYARIYAEDIDEGSWDNCGIASIEVRRNLFDPINFTCGNSFSLWGDYVDFFCCDAGVEIEIQLRVIDEAGNINTCWLNVTPEEKVRPYCEAPHNVEVDCTELPYDFDAYDTDQLEELFGSAIATDNCSGAAADELPPVVDLECGFGRIIRRFRATDEAGNQSTNFCQQIVDIHEVHNYEIRFPADAEAICGVAEPDSVIYEELACDLLAVSHTDEFFSASGEECYKIFRTWKVINWCEYDGESAPLVIGRDEDCDGQPGDEAVWVLRRPNGYTYIDRDNDETEPNNVPLAFQNICQGWDDFWRKEDTTPGYYEYTQIIKVYDDVDPIITAEEQNFCSYDNVNCDGVVVYPFSIEENCTPEDLTIKVFLDAGADGGVDVNLTESGAFGFSLTGTYPDYTIGGQYPIGCHAFEVHVEDGCGNVTASLLPFCVQDCKAPAPICINGLAIELMPFDADGDDVPDEGRMAIWASDFIASPITDCSEPVVYSMNRVGEPKNIDSTGIVLTCADLGTLVVEIWAWDAAGNSDFCETYINVQDNMGNCTGSSPTIAGAVETEYEAPVEDVAISLSGQGAASMQTGADGTYSFAGLVDGYDYTIIPERDGDYLNGVSTFDLVLISQHILGVQLLDSPYKRIAADVNKSESITTLDLIQLRKLILSIDTEFSNNTSWRFVDAAYVFPNPQDPWQEVFPELVNANDLSEYGIAGLDFIAVKIGDVTEDAETTSLLAVEGRTVENTLYLQAEEVSMKAGQEYTINFTIEELQNIYGYQATLNFNTEAVELVDILEGVASEDNFGFTYLDEGAVTTSWNWVPDTEEELPSTLMYSLVLRAKADVNLSEVMSVSSRITKAEAYAVDGQFMDVALSFGLSTPVAKADQFELYQNQPNPANGETLIGFNLPEAATATMTISDITGRVIKLIRLDAVKGYNSVVINASNLPKGVLQYTVKAGQYTDTKSMIITE